MAEDEHPLERVPGENAEGHEGEEDDDYEGQEGWCGPDVEGEDRGGGDARFPVEEGEEVEDGDDEEGVFVGFLPAGYGCLTRGVLVKVGARNGKTHFHTKLKRMSPPTPRYAPIQSTFPPWSDGGA